MQARSASFIRFHSTRRVPRLKRILRKMGNTPFKKPHLQNENCISRAVKSTINVKTSWIDDFSQKKRTKVQGKKTAHFQNLAIDKKCAIFVVSS